MLFVLILGVLVAAALAGGWWLNAGRYAPTPAVLGLSQQVAADTLVAARFEVVVDPEQVFSEDVAAGLVIEQAPPAGDEVRKGSPVTLVLSRGPDRRVVPELVGRTREQATAALAEVGLRPGAVAEQFNAKDAGSVLSAEPPAGQALPPGTAVDLVVSKGVEMLPVPDVRGQQRAAAEKAVTGAGFKPAVSQVFSETVAAGTVLDQSPSSGRAPRGTAVSVKVSKGPELITIPDVVGQPRAQAEAALKALGLQVRAFAIPGPGMVRSTDPPAGQKVRKGATVTVYVF
ncbi:MAG: PASTA domain-containing protein [Actinobacteria bacterium]|nr:PASTA domain-containing protein [Actinomycetota bacterium]